MKTDLKSNLFIDLTTEETAAIVGGRGGSDNSFGGGRGFDDSFGRGGFGGGRGFDDSFGRGGFDDRFGRS
jgi:hypothetical protein